MLGPIGVPHGQRNEFGFGCFETDFDYFLIGVPHVCDGSEPGPARPRKQLERHFRRPGRYLHSGLSHSSMFDQTMIFIRVKNNDTFLFHRVLQSDSSSVIFFFFDPFMADLHGRAVIEYFCILVLAIFLG